MTWGETIRARYWAPPPGNGYGFIYDLKGGRPNGTWSGTWTLADATETKLRLTMLAAGGAQAVYKGMGPSRSGKDRYAYVIARRECEASESLESRFVSVIQAYDERPVVTHISELDKSTGTAQSAALRLALASGAVDYVLSNPRPGTDLQVYDAQTVLATDALFALIRVRGGKIVKWHMVGGTRLKYGEWQVTIPAAEFCGVVESIDYNACSFTTTVPLPSSVIGSVIVFEHLDYMCNTAYKTACVEQLADGGQRVQLEDTTLELASTGIKEIIDRELLELTAPLPTGFNQNIDTGVLHGKVVMNKRTGTSCTICSMKSMSGIHAAIPADWRVGDALSVYDVKAGDTFRLLHQAYGIGE